MSKLSWRELLALEKPLVLPGAYDALSARLIARAGFAAYLVGGFSLVGARYGQPDIGLASLGEMAAGIADITAACSLPVLIDADNGYGDVKNVTHTVRTYERLGASALFLEDQVSPKRCGHFSGKEVVPVELMEQKIRAAVAARDDRDLFLIARTDARSVHGLDEALRRAERYLRAGADGLFVEAPQSVEELAVIARSFDVPQFCNMLIGGGTPILKNCDLYAMGYAMVVHGTTLLMGVTRTVSDILRALRDDTLNLHQGFATLEEYTDAVDLVGWTALERAQDF